MTPRPFVLVLTGLAALLASGRAAAAPPATCVTIEGPDHVADTYIRGTEPFAHMTFGKAKRLLVGDTSVGRAQALIRFDLRSIPAGSVITEATLALDAQTGRGAEPLRIHRITAPWGEDTVTWSGFAGAFALAVDASFGGDGAPVLGPVTFDLRLLTQAWILGTAPNHGLLVDQPGDARTTFWSSEAQGARGPVLRVCYEPPVAQCDRCDALWARRFGDFREQLGFSVATDRAGNVILTGQIAGEVDLGGGPVGASLSDNAFLAKYDPAGHLLWARRFASAGSFGASVAVDGDDDILLTGAYRDPIDFGAGPLANPLGGLLEGSIDFGTGPLTSAGGRDGFVAEFGP